MGNQSDAHTVNLAVPLAAPVAAGDDPTMTDFTDQERDTLRTGAFGAIFLVSNADPGFFATIKESFAGSKVLATASPDLRDLFKSGGVPQMPKGGDAADIEAGVLTALQQATGILQAKAPDQLDNYRTVIMQACEQVAGASEGVKDTETAAIDKVRTALGT
jgi:hypothetical protein